KLRVTQALIVAGVNPEQMYRIVVAIAIGNESEWLLVCAGVLRKSDNRRSEKPTVKIVDEVAKTMGPTERPMLITIVDRACMIIGGSALGSKLRGLKYGNVIERVVCEKLIFRRQTEIQPRIESVLVERPNHVQDVVCAEPGKIGQRIIIQDSLTSRINTRRGNQRRIFRVQ